jgi:putative ABC transport system permease protein
VIQDSGHGPATVPAGARLETGGPEDDLWWVPLATLQRVTGHAGEVSLFQARVRDAGEAARVTARLAADPLLRAVPLHALGAAEGRLLARVRMLLTLVSVAALVAAALTMLGTLTDLALARRRDVATLRALGARSRDVVRLFLAESAVVGVAGGALGYAAGGALAWLVGREVFAATILPRWDVLPVVLLVSVVVALVAAIGPARLALAAEPAAILEAD